MHIYITNFWLAVIFFSFLFILSILPFVYWNYKKYKHFGGIRALGVYLLIFSFLAAFFMVIFPLPEVTNNFCAIRAGKLDPNFEFFRFIREIAEELDGKIGVMAILKSKTFMVTVFNVFLLLPVGFLLRYLFNLKWWKVLLIGFFTSLFFEITQLTGNFGIYPCAYRLFEVDDLMTNTTGAMLGFWLFKYFNFLPSSKIEKEELGKDANLTQRFLVLVFDYLFITYLASFIIPANSTLWLVIVYLAYFILLPKTKFGTTLFEKFFGLRLVKEKNNQKADIKSLTIFYGLLIFFPLISSRILNHFVETKYNNGIYALASILLILIWFVVVFLLPLFRKDKKGLHNILSGLKFVNKK